MLLAEEGYTIKLITVCFKFQDLFIRIKTYSGEKRGEMTHNNVMHTQISFH